MSPLLRKPFGRHGKVHEITPQSAGWRYVGFSLYHLRAGETAAEATGACEVILVMVEGRATLTAAGQDWGSLGDRMSVFEKTPPHCLYVPNGQDWRAVAETDCVIAVCSAPGHGGHSARRIGPDGITLTQRGKGPNTRWINNIAMEGEDYCDSLLVTEVFTPPATGPATPATVMTRTTFSASPIWKRPIIIGSIRAMAGRCSGSIPRTARSTKRWRSAMAMSFACRAAITPAARPMGSSFTT